MALALTHGSVGAFDRAEEDWETYVERVEIYLAANKITDAAERRDVFLSVCGPKTYRVLRDLVAPKKPNEISYTDVVAQLKAHFDPKQGVAVKRYQFNSRSRERGESVSKYVAELRHLAIDCEFGESLNEMLRDRLICGVNDSRMQRRLLSEADLDYDKALKIAQAMEMADKDAEQLKGDKAAPETEGAINKAGSCENRKRGSNVSCYRCGGRHKAPVCRHKETVCHKCGVKGHIARACRSRKRNQSTTQQNKSPPPNTNPVREKEETEDEVYTMFPLRTKKYKPIYVTVQVNDVPLQMEVDTGATLSVIGEATYHQMWGDKPPPLTNSNVRLRTYTGEDIPVTGTLEVEVRHAAQQKQLTLIVTKGSGPSLLGRNWLTELRIDWKTTYQIQESTALTAVLDAHQAVFRKELGTITCAKAELHVDPQVPPVFHRPRTVPFSLKSKVEAELERLQREGTIRPRQFSEWAAPIVAVPKGDGSVRICGDYKVSANKAIICDTHPIPRNEDIFAAMSGGVSFSKLDLSHAYLQLQLDDAARDYLVINTHKGLFEYTRMPFGITSAPAIFQRTMDNLLQGLKHVSVYIDDILITGETDEEHLQTLNEVLTRLETAGVRLKKEKCEFMAKEVIYLGHRINRDGLQPTDEKVQTITDTPRPSNISELRAFLGLINFYGKFMKDLSTILAPLYKLLHKGTAWRWNSAQQKAFEEAKELLKSPKLLVHYDINKELILTCDASPYGLGAVLAHRMEDGSERPIEYASRTLTPAERNYAQIDKEALAIIYGVKRFHQYLYGRHFLICSDHKPLIYLFGEHRGISAMASARVQRWALTLMGYQYSIVHRPGHKLGNADGLSRLPVQVNARDPPQPYDTVFLMERLNSSLVTAAHIRSWTDKDPTLAKVRRQVMQGTWGDIDRELTQRDPYLQRKDELSVEDGCILWGTRVVVPPQLRSRVLDELHEGHPGIGRMKSFARSYVWWPGLDGDLERRVRQCDVCQRVQKMPQKTPVQPWEWPERPWTRLHIDHAGPVQGKMLFIIVDAHSKWIEAHIVSSTSAEATIEKLRLTFATHGLPETIVSDNGPSFTSCEFQEFLRCNGVKHLRSAPYHPASNGLAERAVQTVKAGVAKLSGSLTVRLSRFLFKYRVTPQATTGIAPAELLMGRRLRTHLDLLFPTIQERVRKNQRTQKENRDKHSRCRQFTPGDRVMGRNFMTGPKWMPGTVVECHGNTTIKMRLDDGRIWRRHVDHVVTSQTSERNPQETVVVRPETDPLTAPTVEEPAAVGQDSDSIVQEQCPQPEREPSPLPDTGQEELRRSTRIRKPPDRFE